VKAVQRGEWVVLDNVASANQALLSRLYPLIDQSLSGARKLLVTEHPNSDEVQVHPDFRLFLLWDTSK
jgi:midasin (ATPase involved in ribosome maturation)